MKLTHLGISHFRSIGETPVMIDLSKKITVLVGQNDCGKSNVLRGMDVVCGMRKVKPPRLDEVDFHFRNRKVPLKIFSTTEFLEAPEGERRKLDNISFALTYNAQSELALTSQEIMELDFQQTNFLSKALGHGSKDVHEWARNDQRKEAFRQSNCIGMTQRFRSLLPTYSQIPQYRRIDDKAEYSIEGTGVIKLLSQWQHPEIGHDEKRQKFDQVEGLLRDLVERPHVRLEIPHTHKEILVRDGNLRLPLESHGTGIHQLIILAIAVLSEDNALFGIEEPEIHLHPVLQRRFLKFLREETGDNRYIITTHSQTMIAPAEDVDVIHLKMVDGVTIPTRVTTNAHALEALDDLGVRASDLLQANAVIWVEGPSDRIYLKRWMELVSRELGGPELIEGIDYAMMFYGGRLLSHLSLEREGEIDDGFIQLLRINQRSAIVMDSDRKKRDDALNTTKQRVIAESEANRLHAWVTDGREIENYLTQHTVEAAAKEASIKLDDRFKLIAATSKFDDAFKRMVGSEAPTSCDYAANKVPWAHRCSAPLKVRQVPVMFRRLVDGVGCIG
jgi:predicted ATP-dependent endonuclease of OLD family